MTSLPTPFQEAASDLHPNDQLTASERLIWMGQELDPSAPLYNMALAISVAGPLDVTAFQKAFQQLVAETDALRTSFVAEAGRPRRVVRNEVAAPVTVLDLPAAEFDDAALAAVLEERTRQVFALDGLLFDCCVVERDPGRFVWYLNQHHLITDAWSVGVLHRRLSALYQETEPEGRLPPFADYVQHQRTLRDSPKLTRALAHWEAVATGGSGRNLPLYGAIVGSGRTRRVRVPLGAERSAAMRALAAGAPFRALTPEQSRFQVFATLLLGWQHRVADRAAVAIGTPWHNRSTAAFRNTAGLFIELFPLRVDIDDGETFASLGGKVARGTLEMMRHVVPGASDSAGARGFSVVLNYITAQLGDFAGAPVRADWIHSGFGDRAHLVRLQVHDFDLAGNPTLDFDLDEGVFGDQEREWAVRHFFALFDALAADPGRVIGSVRLTNPEEEDSFAARGPEGTSPGSVLELIRASGRSNPEAVAIRDGQRQMTYRELELVSGRIARRLREEGVGPEVVVGVAVERSAELVVGLLAVLTAGAAFVPLDPAYPDERLGFVVNDSGAKIILTTAELAPRVRALGGTPLIVDGALSDPGDSPPLPPATDPGPATLGYLLYTSGSTGQPKGVEVTHGAFADYVAWAARRYGDAVGLAWPLFTSPAFDLTLTSIFAPLASGGTIVVYRNDAAGGALLVRRVVGDDQVDVVKLTPSHLALVRDLDLSASRIRRLIVGGEDFPRAAALAAHQALGGRAEIVNEYGPTEATVACMVHRFDPATDLRQSVPIGRPSDNARVRVLAPDGAPLPRGVAGEICIGGPGLARGYWRRPDLTEKSFVRDPDSGGRLYRSGDIGRWLPDGTLEYLGRRDEQVKVRGVRIELGEIEAAVTAHPAVESCVAHLSVAAQVEREARCRLCGLEGLHPEARLDAEEICAVCRRFAGERDNVARYFGTMDELRAILAEAAHGATGRHDCLMLYSGGKDSTYALSRIVALGARPLVLLFDNGFISDQAKDNVRRVVETLGLELVVGETPAMPAIFAESLARFSNVCNGCYKAIYTLAMNLAVARGIRHIVTGLSRGQIFETRLADLYRRGIYDPDDVDRTILDARKAYHRMDDAVSRGLDVRIFETDTVLDRIRFVDFYRYSDVSLDEILEHVGRQTPWIRPTDTGRSTNCLINQAGIYVHQTERGFHNYAMPYSWDVRLGHKARDAAVAELDDEFDPPAVRDMLDRVGYRPRPPMPQQPRLVAYYTAPKEIPAADLRQFLERTLPRDVIPAAFVRLDGIPLAASGKVDRSGLPQPEFHRPSLAGAYVAPRTPTESLLADLWSEVLDVEPIGVHDDFFELGGDSMQCVQIVASARARGAALEPRDLFAHRTIAALATVVSPAKPGAVRPAAATATELAELVDEFGGALEDPRP